jgi:hypothetical protein
MNPAMDGITRVGGNILDCMQLQAFHSALQLNEAYPPNNAFTSAALQFF